MSLAILQDFALFRDKSACKCQPLQKKKKKKKEEIVIFQIVWGYKLLY